MARGRYRRQREYPQPPPPSKNSTTITINRVSISSPLFELSIHNSIKSTLCARTCGAKKAVVPGRFVRLIGDKDESAVVYVESLDEKVE